MRAYRYNLSALKVGGYVDVRRPPKWFVYHVSKIGRELQRQFATRVITGGERRVMRVE
jgi:hypothetical protein